MNSWFQVLFLSPHVWWRHGDVTKGDEWRFYRVFVVFLKCLWNRSLYSQLLFIEKKIKDTIEKTCTVAYLYNDTRSNVSHHAYPWYFMELPQFSLWFYLTLNKHSLINHFVVPKSGWTNGGNYWRFYCNTIVLSYIFFFFFLNFIVHDIEKYIINKIQM